MQGTSRYQVLYFEDLRIVSVDGRREGGQSGWPYAASVSVPAGTHWVQFLLSRNNSDITMCAFQWTFEGGWAYRLDQLAHGQPLLAHAAAPRFPASVSMVVTDASGRSHWFTARAECGKEASCRESSDCPANRECQMDAGFEFGVCRSGGR